MTSIVGFDTETHLIGEGEIVPRLVCATFDRGPWDGISPDGGVAGYWERWCVPNSDPTLVHELLSLVIDCMAHRNVLVAHEVGFDMPVIMRYAWDVMEGTQVANKEAAEELYARLWDVLEQGLDQEFGGGRPTVHDTKLREQLYNLSTHGGIEKDRYSQDIRYSLADLVKLYFNVDISDTKVSTDMHGRVLDHKGVDITGTPAAAAAWRLRYSELDGIPAAQWPPEAVDYALSDATWARKVFVMQERNRQPSGFGSMNSESLQVYSAIALRLYSMTGFRVDRERVAKVEQSIDDVMKKVSGTLLVNGILRPDGSCNTKVLKERVRAAWATKSRPPVLTAGGDISAAADVLETLSGVDPILDLYAERQDLAKIHSAFIPNLQGTRVYHNYDVLKETGRTSSYGNSEKDKRKPLFPAENIQQMPRKFGIREAHLPPEGYVQVSIDYASLELCSVAQVTYSLFGFSVHREKRNQGYDLHAYLGSGMAMVLEPEVVAHATDHEAAYATFEQRRGANIPDTDMSPEAEQDRKNKKATKHWRNLAKPTGLGYPGGLGPATQVTFARTMYGIQMTEEQARTFRDLWHRVYPEMRRAFDWVNEQVDHSRPNDQLYCYETAGLRRFRAGATYCATANGKFMQSLSADGAKRSVCWVARAAFAGAAMDSAYAILAGCLPQAFIHDENIIAIPDDELLTERSLLFAKLMIVAMQVHMPDVLIGAEPAAMRRWTKDAEPEWEVDPARPARVEALLGSELFTKVREELGPTYDPTRRLIPWDDKHKVV